jgi:hypothetical protein
MTDEIPDNLKIRAAAIVNDLAAVAAEREQDLQVANEYVGTLIEALAQDLHAVTDNANVAEERLVKMESQTRVPGEAVIAIAEPAEAVAPAVQAVKLEM